MEKVHVWIVCHGIYTKKQKMRQRLFALGMIQDFADNLQRFLGVRDCLNYPTVSGLCNNKRNVLSGITYQELLKPVDHQRKTTHEMHAMLPNVRQVSNKIFKQTDNHVAPRRTNALMVFFGQFIDHEITLSPGEHVDSEASAPIQHPQSSRVIRFTRSGILRYPYHRCCSSGYLTNKVWEGSPFNILTSYIDAGAVYGSENLRAVTLRSYKHGRLILKRRFGELLLPMNCPSDVKFRLTNEPNSDDGNLFLAGDVRANENPMLLSLHTAFAREHNRVCRLLRRWLERKRKLHLLKDEWLYKTAKMIVSAELQSITFNEFIPAMLGKDALGKYQGYDSRIDTRISTFHSTIAYRWGHSSIAEEMNMTDRKGRLKTLLLRDMFFNSTAFLDHGVDNILLSAMNTPAQDIDEQVVDSLRDFLFHANESGVLDLAALNLQRSRDLGIPSYTELQAQYKTGEGLKNIKKELQQKLLHLYGTPDKIDAFADGLCEEKKAGSLMGPLFTRINVEQFEKIRDGDRFYYENIRWDRHIRKMPLIKMIRKHKIRLHHVVYGNTGIKRFSEDVGSRPAYNLFLRRRGILGFP